MSDMVEDDGEQVWEFTFMCVQAAKSREQALAAALEYLAEYADKGELFTALAACWVATRKGTATNEATVHSPGHHGRPHSSSP